MIVDRPPRPNSVHIVVILPHKVNLSPVRVGGGEGSGGAESGEIFRSLLEFTAFGGNVVALVGG